MYLTQEKYDLAIKFYEDALLVKEQIGNPKQIATTLNNLGEVYLNTNKLIQAEDHFLRSLALKEKSGDVKGIATTCNQLARLHLQQKMYAQVEPFLLRARKISEEIGAQDLLLKNLEISKDYYLAKKEFDKAIQFYDQFVSLKDTILNEEQGMAIADMQIKYETEKKEQENAILHEQSLAQNAKLKTQQLLIISLIMEPTINEMSNSC